MTYQFTALYGDDEVGYAEAETYEDALFECADSVPSIYPDDDVSLVCRHPVTGMKVSVTLEAVHMIQMIDARF